MRQLLANNMENLPPVLPRGQVTEGLPTLSKRVTMYQDVRGKTIKNRIILKVYDSFDSYAVLSQDKVVGKDCGCFSLKNYTYKMVPAGRLSREHKFQVVPRNCEGTVLTFSTGSKQETAKWVEELTRLAGPADPPVALRSVLRPISPRAAAAGAASGNKRSSIGSAGGNKRSSLLPALEEEENNEE